MLTSARARRSAPADTRAVTQPDCARPQHTAQLAGSRRVHAITRAEREELVITIDLACRVRWTARQVPQARGRGSPATRAGALAETGNREPVVRVWPASGLRRVAACRAHPVGQLSQLVPAPLPDSCEGHRVSAEAQRDLVGLAGAVMTAHGLDRQHRTIYAA